MGLSLRAVQSRAARGEIPGAAKLFGTWTFDPTSSRIHFRRGIKMRGEDNLYQRGGIWWLRAEVRGREYRESLRTADVKSARRLRDSRLKELRDAIWHGERRRSWQEAVVAWGGHADAQLGPSTVKRYLVSLAQCDPYLSQFDIDKIDGRAIAALIQARQSIGATPATIRRDLTAVSRVLEYAEAMEWREGNPTLSKRKILKERRDPIELPVEASIDFDDRRFFEAVRRAHSRGTPHWLPPERACNAETAPV